MQRLLLGLERTVPDDHAALGHYGFMAAFGFTIIGAGLLASLRLMAGGSRRGSLASSLLSSDSPRWWSARPWSPYTVQ